MDGLQLLAACAGMEVLGDLSYCLIIGEDGDRVVWGGEERADNGGHNFSGVGVGAQGGGAVAGSRERVG